MENKTDFEKQKPNKDGEITRREWELLQQYRKTLRRKQINNRHSGSTIIDT